MIATTLGILLGITLAAEPAPPGVLQMPSGLLVECEDFKLQGKWKLRDKDPARFSGKGYVTETASAGIARTAVSKKITLPKPGKYNVWIRAYLGGKQGTGIFDRQLAVAIDGNRLATTHRGLDADQYRWELAGTIDAGKKTEVLVEIYDRGRSPVMADCLLLTDELEFKPVGWQGNSRRPSLTVPFCPPQITPSKAKPYAPTKAPKEHVENVTGREHEYQVNVAGTLDEFNTAEYPNTYNFCKRLESKFQPNEYLVVENLGNAEVVNPRIVINGRRDWFSAESILSSILLPGMTDAEKAMAIWRFASSIEVQCHDNNRRVGPYYPEECSQPSRNTYKERGNPVKATNCYYCSGCQLSATNCVVLLRTAGLPARAVWMCPIDEYENHCVAEAWHDGGWHLYDPERRSFYLESDNTTVASYETLHKNPPLAARTHDGGFASEYMGMKSHDNEYKRYFPPSVMPVERWVSTMGMALRPGEKFIWRWDHLGKFRCGYNPRNRNYEPYRLANGKVIYRPDLKNPNFRTGIVSERNIKTTAEDGRQPAIHANRPGAVSFVSYKVKTAYPIVGGVVGGRFFRKTKDDLAKIYISIGDSDWTEIWSADGIGQVETYLAVDDILGTKFAAPRYECYVKYEFCAAAAPSDAGVDGVYLEFDVQMSGAGLPSLSVGSNTVVYRDDTQGPRSVRLTHGWKESPATQPPLPPSGPVTPADGARLKTLEKLVWTPAQDPDGQEIADYHVQLSPRQDMHWPLSPNFDRLTFSGKPEWDVPQGWFVKGRTYYWRVRARDKWGAWSGWSDVWKFQIDR